jgi:hypothetical protein
MHNKTVVLKKVLLQNIHFKIWNTRILKRLLFVIRRCFWLFIRNLLAAVSV